MAQLGDRIILPVRARQRPETHDFSGYPLTLLDMQDPELALALANQACGGGTFQRHGFEIDISAPCDDNAQVDTTVVDPALSSLWPILLL